MLHVMNGKWTVKSTETAYEHEWLKVEVAHVELTDKTVTEYAVVKFPKQNSGVCVIAIDEQKNVLLIWRHRFVTDTWTWELPRGGVDLHEPPAAAASRELFEETGWKSEKLTHLTKFQPYNSLMDCPLDVYLAESPTWGDKEPDRNEVGDMVWVSKEELMKIISKGDLSDGMSLTALLWAMQFGPLSS